MCKNKIYHQSGQGYVAICQECFHVEIAYGTLISRISKEEFYAFVSYVNKMLYWYEDNRQNRRKEVHLSMLKGRFYMVLTPFELHQLAYMVNDAQAAMEIESLMENL